ncbi:PKD domain-containing protein [Flavobacterium sp.]|uniref:PKD domain-containing protein n=1 Tax=Flavobacterium sp. TaxID=239 RepID=UPI00286B288B|nr:PKD domain-containing protein [Flavobacterium sp.]
MKKLKILLFVLLFFYPKFVEGQTKVKDTITRKATINYDKKGNQVIFKPEVPPLIQVAGAPKASFSYFWEMGDGSFSKEVTPKKVYKKPGEYKINLAVTNNYDNGKPPKTRPKTVAVTEITETKYDEIASIETLDGFNLFTNRDPVPEEEMVLAISYQNLLDYTTNGKLYLFYNDKEFKNKNFELLETRTHFGEKEINETGIACVDDFNNSNQNVASSDYYPSFRNSFSKDEENLELSLAESKMLFSDVKVFEFDNMEAKQTRNMFFTFKTTKEMVKDTSAIVKIRSIYVPDRSYKNHKKKTLEMEIVTSHDPNKMSSNGTSMNYRLVRFKNLNFKTRFQNDGEGPARMIRLETDIPDMFDKKTLQIVDSYPKCSICPKGEEVNYSCLDTIIKKNQIHFVFKNIYVPGSNQKNVKEKDSTKGFVKYTMKFAKDFHKQTTRSKTAIIFDKNEPVITNYAVTRFKPGISIGVRTGYNLFPDQENSKSYFLGATISPYKSYRFYWQSELYYSYFESNFSSVSDFQQVPFNPPVLMNGTIYDTGFTQTSINSKTVKNIVEVVPVSLRYNINNYIGLGVGPQFSVLLSQTDELNRTRKIYAPIFTTTPPSPGEEIESMRTSNSQKNTTNAFEKMQTSIFADATFGFARIGPSFGIRYYLNFETDFNYWQFYAIWKF